MFRQEIKFIFRKLLRNKSYTLINLTGLTIALTASLLIFKHINREWESDRFHPNTKKIYRVTHSDQNSPRWSGLTYGIIGPYAQKEIPGIENYARCFLPQSLGIQLEENTELFLESACMYADLSFFDLFHFPILTGNIHTSDISNWVVLSSRKAEQLFGTQNPIGKTIRAKYISREDSGKEFQVIAVMDNFPPTSSVQADIILSPVYEKDIFERWGVIGTYLFLQLNDQANPAEIEKAIPLLTTKYFPIGTIVNETFRLQPFRDIYFHSDHIAPDNMLRGSWLFTLLLCSITLLILFLAASNYIMIKTAQFQQKEITGFALQKCFGADSGSFKLQLFAEIGLQILVALGIAIVAGYLLHPVINRILSPHHPYAFTFGGKEMLLFLLIITITAGMIGSFLYFYIRKRLGRNGLYRSLRSAPPRSNLKQVLTISQIAIFCALLFSSIIIYRQMNYIKNKNLGYNTQNTLHFVIPNRSGLCKEELLRNPDIVAVSNGSSLPVAPSFYIDLYSEDKPDHQIKIQTLIGDNDYLSTYRITLSEGRMPRKLSAEYDPDNQNSYYGEVIVNKALVEALNLKSPLDAIINLYDTRVKIVGVTENFHFNPLYQPIQPVVIYDGLYMQSTNLIVRYQPGKHKEVINYIQQVYARIYPGSFFDYHEYADSDFYDKDIATVKIITIFTIIAILIGGMGIFSFSTFIAQTKRKEIALRKINGASEFRIIRQLNRNFMGKTLIACTLSIPTAYVLSYKWLEGFAYKTEMAGWIFIFVPGMVALIVLGVTTWQIRKAARTNPVEVLKNE